MPSDETERTDKRNGTAASTPVSAAFDRDRARYQTMHDGLEL